MDLEEEKEIIDVINNKIKEENVVAVTNQVKHENPQLIESTIVSTTVKVLAIEEDTWTRKRWMRWDDDVWKRINTRIVSSFDRVWEINTWFGDDEYVNWFLRDMRWNGFELN